MKKKFRAVVERNPGQFALYFDFSEPVQAAPSPSDLYDLLAAHCQDWLNAGNQIVPGCWGVKSVNCFRDADGVLHGTYQLVGEICDPFGLLLNGRESHFMPLFDAIKILGVDEFWGVGFLHGFDRVTAMITDKRLDVLLESQNYLDGRDVGSQLRARFVKEAQRAVA